MSKKQIHQQMGNQLCSGNRKSISLLSRHGELSARFSSFLSRGPFLLCLFMPTWWVGTTLIFFVFAPVPGTRSALNPPFVAFPSGAMIYRFRPLITSLSNTNATMANANARIEIPLVFRKCRNCMWMVCLL